MKVLRRKKIFTFFIYFVLLALTMLNLANYKWTKEPHECNHQVRAAPENAIMVQSRPDTNLISKAPPMRKRQVVYVLTTWRSGSSFFGELFNQNPKVFFLYEPMWHIWQKLYPGDAATLQGAARDMLSALYRCDFSIFHLYDGPSWRNISTLSIFGGAYNKVICSYPLCPYYKKDVVGMVSDTVCKKCPTQYLPALQNECLKYDTIVIKGVRILDINILAPLIEDSSVELKVIHLVRDPRAVANSRIKSKFGLVRENLQVVRSRDPKVRQVIPKGVKKDSSDYNAVGAMEVICSHMSKTLNTALIPPSWLKGKYMTVRYEDLVENPIKILRSIYNFTNLPANKDMEAFTMNMTSGSNSKRISPFRVSSRNATVAASAWRRDLSYQQIKQVEEYCHHSMSLLGYETVSSPAEVKDLRKSLLTAPKV